MKFFLRKVEKYIVPFFDIYSYCLMPNHFHFILKAKSIPIIATENVFRSKGLHSEDNVFSKSLAKLISSYTQAFNKVYIRSGSLFESPFKRIIIDSDEYLKKLIIYIHQNPNDFQNYKFSSYKAIISNFDTSIKRNEVLDLFESKDNFIHNHNIIISNL